MNILVLISQAKSCGHVVSTFTIMKKLKGKGHNIIWVSDEGDLVDEIRSAGFEYHRISHYCRRSLLFLKNVIPLIHIIQKQHVDIIFCQELFGSNPILANIIKIMTKKPLITTIAGGILSPNTAYSLADVVVVFSEELKLFLSRAADFKEKKVVIIPHRIDCEIGDTLDSGLSLRQEYGISSNEKVILLISSLTRGKKVNPVLNFLSIIPDIFIKTPNIRVLIAGGGEMLSAVEKKAEKINVELGKNIIIPIGTVKNIFMHEYFKITDIIIAMGRSALEGMAMAKPVLLLGYDGIVDVVDQQKASILAFHNFSGRDSKTMQNEAILENIMRLIGNQSFADELGRQNREYVLANYDIRIGVEQYEKIIYELTKDCTPLPKEEIKKMILGELRIFCSLIQRNIECLLSRAFPRKSR